MAGLPFNSNANIDKTRAAMGQRLGEIIETVIGDARVRELFDKAGTHPSEYEGKPTGLMALDLKVITPETKTALLVAQAAERTYALAEKAENLAAHSDRMLRAKQYADQSLMVDHSDPVFKFVGSERDPAVLRRAQGTWMAAQLLLNHEVGAINGPIETPLYAGNPSSMGVKAAQGFKEAAASLYGEAAVLLRAEGHVHAADSLQNVSVALAAASGKDGLRPADTLERMGHDFSMGSQNLAIILSDDRYYDRQPIEDVYSNLMKLVAIPTPSIGRAPDKPGPG